MAHVHEGQQCQTSLKKGSYMLTCCLALTNSLEKLHYTENQLFIDMAYLMGKVTNCDKCFTFIKMVPGNLYQSLCFNSY